MPSEYYSWREFEGTLAGWTIRWAGKPGLQDWDALPPAVQLLAAQLQKESGLRVLDLRCGTGALGALAASQGRQVTLCDDNLVAVQSAGRTLAFNAASGQIVHGLPPLPEALYDLVLLSAPRGREWVRHLLRAAAQCLAPGGKLLLAGPNRGGIKGFIEDAIELIGPGGVIAYKAGHRLAALSKRQASAAEPAGLVQPNPVCRVQLAGREIQFAGPPGVFSQGELDRGTQALIEAMRVQPGEAVLDLGCGSGIVGAVAAQVATRVTLVDASAAALQAAQATLALNGVTNVEVLASDCGSAALDRPFEMVATNPPFHQGPGVEYDVARQFVRDAAQVLVPGGRLYLVANSFIRYEREMTGLYAQINTVYQDSRFRVLEAVR